MVPSYGVDAKLILDKNQKRYFYDYFRALGGQWEYFLNENHINLQLLTEQKTVSSSFSPLSEEPRSIRDGTPQEAKRGTPPASWVFRPLRRSTGAPPLDPANFLGKSLIKNLPSGSA